MQDEREHRLKCNHWKDKDFWKPATIINNEVRLRCKKCGYTETVVIAPAPNMSENYPGHP